MLRGDLTDTQWERLEPLLPPQKPPTGRPDHDHRTIINGMLWIDRTGAPWRDLPERFGKWKTVYSRSSRWQKAGVWDRILAALQATADAAGALDWAIHFIDSSVIRAHQHAAGARGRNPDAQALGRSQGGFGTKLHLRCEGTGKPMTFVLTPGQRHDTVALDALLDQGAVKRPGRGRPRLRPQRLAADKGYASRAIRQRTRRRGIRTTIPHKTTERRSGPFDRAAYRRRNVVERLINRLKQFRRLATRYEKLAANYLAMVTIAALLLWI